MELTLQQRHALIERALAWADAPAGTQAGAAWAVVEGYVSSLVQEGEGERKRLAERCETLAKMYNRAAEERHKLRVERDAARTVRDDLEQELCAARGTYDDLREERDAIEVERDDLRNRLELIETACTAHRVEVTGRKTIGWHAQAAEELARAEVSTAGHGDPSDGQRATGWGPLS